MSASTTKERIYSEKGRRRFLSKVVPEPNTGCWLWTPSSRGSERGYGSFQLRGRAVKAHRVAYTTFVGDIPPGQFVLHSCDTPACVNPDHLRAGTHQENQAESARKQRRADVRGGANPRSRLTRRDVLSIRSSPASHHELSRAYGVDPKHIQRIRRRVVWRHV